MRPLELTLEGFRSYRDRVTFDWRGRRLVGIVGPIGSGKSSILDAVSFALFAKTPSIEQNTKSLIHQLLSECHVELRFEVEGQVWRAVRALRRKGQAGHSLYRLAADEPDAEVIETISGERPVNERVAQLLGMDFKAFCRSVLLAQNRFSEFLQATPADRDRVLKGVFGYERLDEALVAAKGRLARADLELEALEKEGRQIAEARQELDAARAQAAAAGARAAELRGAAEEIERLDKQRNAAVSEAEASSHLLAALVSLTETLPTSDEVDLVLAAAGDSAGRVAKSIEALEEAQRIRSEREADLEQLAAKLGDRERFRSFELLVRRQEQEAAAVVAAESALLSADEEAARSRDELAQRKEALEASQVAVSDAESASKQAEELLLTAREALIEAEHAEMATGLRGTLHVGQRCPVCDQPVHAVPKAKAAPKLAGARKAVASAEGAQQKSLRNRESVIAAEGAASAGLADAKTRLASSEAILKKRGTEVAAVEAALTRTQGQLVEWLGQGDPRLLLEARQAELTVAETALDESRSSVEGARADHDEAVRAGAAATGALGGLANKLAGAWGRFGEERDVAADPSDVAEAFAQVREAIVSRHDQAAAAGEEAEEMIKQTSLNEASIMSSLGLSAGDDFRAALTHAEVLGATTQARVSDLETRLSRAGELEGRVQVAQAGQSLARRLCEDLKPSRFLAFLLEEERVELAELGSLHLELLTDGGYRFADDGGFDVADLNAAGAIRKADSLSGGETFLASLALALALAQMVARGGGRLDSFFLDEGFGSLDPEHLDKAMDGIGRLVAQDDKRLVVLVSHVSEMREAVEDLIVLDKNGLTGDSMIMSGAAGIGPRT